MLELLQAGHRLGGAELARRLGVDERTVRRYAARLDDLGVPVVADRGRYGGYRLMPGYKLPPLMLTDDEAVAVVLGLLAGRRTGLPGPAAESALAKVQRVLPDALRDRVQALRDTLGFTGPDRAAGAAPGAVPDTGAVLTLAAAAREHRRVRLRYRSWRGEETERDLDPHGLVLHSGRWYVTGHDHRSGANMAVTGAADRMPSRIARVVYVDTGPMPSGMAAIDFHEPSERAELERAVAEEGGGRVIPVPPFDPAADPVNLAGLSAARLAELRERATPQPFGTATQPAARPDPLPATPRTLIATTIPLDVVRRLGEDGHPVFAAMTGPGWEYRELATGHWPMLSEPAALAALLAEAAG